MEPTVPIPLSMAHGHVHALEHASQVLGAKQLLTAVHIEIVGMERV